MLRKIPSAAEFSTHAQYINNQMGKSRPKIVTKAKYTSTDRVVSALPRRYYFAQITHQSNNMFLCLKPCFEEIKIHLNELVKKRITFVMETRPSIGRLAKCSRANRKLHSSIPPEGTKGRQYLSPHRFC